MNWSNLVDIDLVITLAERRRMIVPVHDRHVNHFCGKPGLEGRNEGEEEIGGSGGGEGEGEGGGSEKEEEKDGREGWEGEKDGRERRMGGREGWEGEKEVRERKR